MLRDLKIKLGNKWPTFSKLHRLIKSLNSKVEFHVFPIYVSYYLGDDTIVIVYFRGKFVSENQLDVGFAFRTKPKNSAFVNAKYMKCPKINYSIKLSDPRDITKELTKTINSMIIK